MIAMYTIICLQISQKYYACLNKIPAEWRLGWLLRSASFWVSGGDEGRGNMQRCAVNHLLGDKTAC